jgi:hypothetical protein
MGASSQRGDHPLLKSMDLAGDMKVQKKVWPPFFRTRSVGGAVGAQLLPQNDSLNSLSSGLLSQSFCKFSRGGHLMFVYQVSKPPREPE